MKNRVVESLERLFWGGFLLFVLFFKKISVGGELFGAASPHFTLGSAALPSLVSGESHRAAVHASGPHLCALHGSHHCESPER